MRAHQRLLGRRAKPVRKFQIMSMARAHELTRTSCMDDLVQDYRIYHPRGSTGQGVQAG
jgi:hypothetical protein